jgi:ribose transport system substrate-binding protein
MEALVHLKGDEWDGVALSPVDARSQTHWINKLSDVTNVVTFDTDAELSDRQSHVGASNFSAGRACARIVGEALPEGGKVAILIANQTQENLIDRKGGFQENLSRLANDVEDESSGPRLTIVAFLEDGGDDKKCAENIRQTLEEHPDLDAFVGLNARHGPVLLDVLGELDKLDEIKLVTFDATPATLDGIAAGHIYATIAQDQFKYGYEAVKILATLAHGDDTAIPIVGRGSNYIGFEAVTQENLEEFRSRIRNQPAADKDTAG